MRVQEGRLDVKLISPDGFKEYLDYRKMTYADVAKAATRAGVPTSKATIGHIVNRKVKTVKPTRAQAIADALDVPVRMLFMDTVSIVQRDVPPKKGKAA